MILKRSNPAGVTMMSEGTIPACIPERVAWPVYSKGEDSPPHQRLAKDLSGLHRLSLEQIPASGSVAEPLRLGRAAAREA